MNIWLLEGKVGGRDRLGVWNWRVHTAIFKTDRDFPGGPVVKNPACRAGDMSLIPGGGSKIPSPNMQPQCLFTSDSVLWPFYRVSKSQPYAHFGSGSSLLWKSLRNCRLFSSIPGLWPVDAGSNSTFPHVIHDNHKCVQTLPYVSSEDRINLVYEPRVVKDREAWCATVHGATKSQTWLSNWTTPQQEPLSYYDFLNSLKILPLWLSW